MKKLVAVLLLAVILAGLIPQPVAAQTSPDYIPDPGTRKAEFLLGTCPSGSQTCVLSLDGYYMPSGYTSNFMQVRVAAKMYDSPYSWRWVGFNVTVYTTGAGNNWWNFGGGANCYPDNSACGGTSTFNPNFSHDPFTYAKKLANVTIGVSDGQAYFSEISVYVSNVIKDPSIPNYCKPTSVNNTYDLVQLGTVTAGSLIAQHITDWPTFTDRLQATLSYTLPAAISGSSGFLGGTLYYYFLSNGQVTNLANLPTGSFTINGTYYSGLAGSTYNIAIPAGATTITVSFDQTITGTFADQTQSDPVRLAQVLLTVPTGNPGLLNCDGEMEADYTKTPWLKLQDNLSLERLGLSAINDLLDGTAACGRGFEAVGRHSAPLGLSTGAEVYDRFSVTVPGTTYWKFRYRSLDIFGLFPSSPNIYLVSVDDNGNPGGVVAQLFGGPGFDATLARKDWTLVTGTVSLSAGDYAIVAGIGLPAGGWTSSWPVYYDDMYLSTLAFDGSCTVENYIPPVTITPPPSPTVTGSATPTGTGEPSSTPFLTPTFLPSKTVVTATVTLTRTLTVTPGPSNTPRNTATARPTWTATINWGNSTSTSVAATGTAIQALTGTPTLNLTATSQAHNDTFNQGTPYVSFDPWAINPYTGQPLSGDYTKDCARPDGWDLSLSKWLDYEFCRLISFTTFGPSQQATAQAIPAMFNRYEPFGTINEIQSGITSVRSTAMAYPWNQTGVQGVNDPINTQLNSILKGGTVNGQDPWAAGAKPFDLTPTDKRPGGAYGLWCNSRLSTLFATNLAQGACYALNFARSIGWLPWVQFFLNVAVILGTARVAFGFMRDMIGAR